jgi:hypothetical protein
MKALVTGRMMLVTAAAAAVLLLGVTAARSRWRQLLRLKLWVLQCRRCRQGLCLPQLSAEWLLRRQTRQTHHSHQQHQQQLSLMRCKKSRSTAQLQQALLLTQQLAVLGLKTPHMHLAVAF